MLLGYMWDRGQKLSRWTSVGVVNIGKREDSQGGTGPQNDMCVQVCNASSRVNWKHGWDSHDGVVTKLMAVR